MAKLTIKMDYDDKDLFHDTEITFKIPDDCTLPELHEQIKNAVLSFGFGESLVEQVFGRTLNY